MNTKAQKILSDDKKCPICGVYNLVWADMENIAKIAKVKIPQIDVRGATYDVLNEKVTNGTACWDSSYGDECGSCLNIVVNSETALVGPMGYCH